MAAIEGQDGTVHANPTPSNDDNTVWLSRHVFKRNIRSMRFNLTEFSGSLGDLATFIPLTAGLAFATGMDLGLILIFAGLASVLAGILFGLPIPVQPMKAIAAVAIAEGLLPGEVAAAGLVTGAVLFIVGITRFVSVLERLVPLPVVRGIQFGIGIKLILKAVDYVRDTPLFGWDSVTLAVGLAALVLLFGRVRRFPVALLLFVYGVFVIVHEGAVPVAALAIGTPQFSILLPSAADWVKGFTHGAVPQIPLTILNSVFAVCLLSGDLFPGRRLSSPATALSVAAMNLFTCWFGAMPMCHGSGGLAGQYYFGARTGGSMVMLGTLKFLVGLLFGSAAATVIAVFPESVLGVLLLFAGLELATTARDYTGTTELIVILATGAVIVAVDALIGCLVGAFAAFILRTHTTPGTSGGR